jgi:hypothetical protein
MNTTLWGCALAVGSSSLLYLNLLLWAAFTDEIGSSNLLNPGIVGINLDSIMNDIGMLMVCGLLNPVYGWLSSKLRDNGTPGDGPQLSPEAPSQHVVIVTPSSSIIPVSSDYPYSSSSNSSKFHSDTENGDVEIAALVLQK